MRNSVNPREDKRARTARKYDHDTNMSIMHEPITLEIVGEMLATLARTGTPVESCLPPTVPVSVRSRFDDTARPMPCGKALAEGWVELRDPASMRPYYYNKATGESRWDPPREDANGVRAPLERPASSAQLWLKNRERQQQKFTPPIAGQASALHLAASSTASTLQAAASHTASSIHVAASHLEKIKHWKRRTAHT